MNAVINRIKPVVSISGKEQNPFVCIVRARQAMSFRGPAMEEAFIAEVRRDLVLQFPTSQTPDWLIQHVLTVVHKYCQVAE